MTKQMTPANTGAWEYDLLAAVIQRAILDATKGSGEPAEQAAQWLDDIWPSWREMSQQNGPDSTKTNAGHIDTHQTANVESGPSEWLTTGS